MICYRTGIRGFTLFEILIAVSIFAVIGTIAMTNLIQVGRTGERISNAQQQLSEIQFAVGYLGKDLAQLVNRKVRDQYGDEQNQFILKDNLLIFTRGGWANLLQQNRSQLQRVAYRQEDDSLIREYWLELDQGYSEQRVKQSLLKGIEDFEVKLITSQTEKLNAWPADNQAQTSNKPVAVEVSMVVKDFGLIQRVFEVTDVFQ